MATKDIIGIGGSSGSNEVLQQIFEQLPSDIPASIFVATHMSPHSPGLLADILQSVTALPTSMAHEGQPVQKGHVYVAAPDRHLVVLDGTIRRGHGPRENMSRPSIDPLFRSLALSYGGRATGVILSGKLNDGASGLAAIKQCGGTAVVQHPLDALADEMPLAALEVVDADFVASAADMADLLTKISVTEALDGRPPSKTLRLEVQIALGRRLGSEKLRQVAAPSALSCPECHGVLSEVCGEQPLRFRCQTGHAQTAAVLAADTSELDEAMLLALRVMEERVTLVDRMAKDARDSGRQAIAELYEARGQEYGHYAQVLRAAANEG